MELQVGHGPSGAADRLAVHPADEADERFRRRKKAQDVIPLIVEGSSADLDQARIVRPSVSAYLAQSIRIKLGRGRGRGGRGCSCIESLYGWMIGQFHDGSSKWFSFGTLKNYLFRCSTAA
jgi:hypothetical protein